MEVQEFSNDKRRFSELFNPRDELSDPPDSPVENDGPMQEDSHSPDIDAVAPIRRSARKKIRTSMAEQVNVISKPVKLTARSTENAIKKYYLDKKVKLSNLALETIYEEPQVINNEEVIMSTRRFRRTINFDVVNSRNNPKTKRRKNKAKKIKCKKASKVTLKVLMDKLNEISD